MVDYPASLLARFWAKVDDTAGPEACWPWTGATQRQKTGEGRVGRIRRGGRADGHLLAHRVALALHSGIDSPGRDAHHLCGVALCCNGTHLIWIDSSPHRSLSNHRRRTRGRS